MLHSQNGSSEDHAISIDSFVNHETLQDLAVIATLDDTDSGGKALPGSSGTKSAKPHAAVLLKLVHDSATPAMQLSVGREGPVLPSL